MTTIAEELREIANNIQGRWVRFNEIDPLRIVGELTALAERVESDREKSKHAEEVNKASRDALFKLSQYFGSPCIEVNDPSLTLEDGFVDWVIQRHEELKERAEKVPDGLSAVLDKYELQTRLLPMGHEIPERGCSTFNWRMSVIRDLWAMLAAAPEPVYEPDPAITEKWESGEYGRSLEHAVVAPEPPKDAP